jgi:hypothetical protein
LGKQRTQEDARRAARRGGRLSANDPLLATTF